MLNESDGGGEDLFTPPPGDPDAIRAHASRLKSHGTKMGDVGYAARRSRGEVDDWTGEAADGFGSFSGDVAALAAGAESPAEAMARGVIDYADALETLKKKLRDAKERKQHADAKATSIADDVNSNPHRTDAQVTAAQGRIDDAESDAADAVADAQRAWDAYNADSEAAAKAIAAAGQGLSGDSRAAAIGAAIEESGEKGEEGGWLEKLLEDNEWIHVGGTFGGIDYATTVFGKLFDKEFQSAAKSSRSIAELLEESKGEVRALLSEIGPAGMTDDQEDLMRMLAYKVGHIQLGFAEPAAQDVTDTLAKLRIPAGAGIALGGLGLIGDVETFLHPADHGRLGSTVDRAMSLANAGTTGKDIYENVLRFTGHEETESSVESVGESVADAAGEAAGEAAGDAAAGGALEAGAGLGAEAAELAAVDASTAAIPGVGEAVMLGTGAYLAGDFLYHHWPSFHHLVDHGAHAAVDVANAQREAVTGAYHVGSDVAKGGYEAASDLNRGAIHTASDLMHGNFSHAGSDLTSAGSQALSDAGGAAHHAIDDAGHAVSQIGGSLKDAGHNLKGLGRDYVDMQRDEQELEHKAVDGVAHGISKGVSAVKGWF